MNGITDPAPVVCAVILGNDNRGSRAPNRGKRFLADKVADDDRIRSVIELLKKSSK